MLVGHFGPNGPSDLILHLRLWTQKSSPLENFGIKLRKEKKKRKKEKKRA